MSATPSRNPAKSIEGYTILVTGLHPETTEEQVEDLFLDFGPVRNLHLNLDRRTGYVKGYALLEYAELEQAQKAVEASQLTLLGHKLQADYAFLEPPVSHRMDVDSRSRSQSPARRDENGTVSM
ncbi:RNA-binding protein [Schizosaccharomyces japonicus yFS275]|uniref:RNA-binding protein n=1 Tax=Schizosaccharomyces japonicus (strain yFS275 / FY16936) TaxID=402676 RepID=B6JZ29_SCHJY|nr:RNA-binding protein [Schizosaccharomyces japonicus yFS275]EEB06797.1 RNA-binding protein [Schizosaccharomyces japonicus yFS275]